MTRNNGKSAPKVTARGIKNKVTALFELPREIVLNLPLITITGNEEISVENYKGVIEYSEERIRINTSCGVLRIEGRKLLLKQITAEMMTISGAVTRLEYLM
ncbi:MAG: sporulation protein YqfC [Clostridiales bacterium]|jgi:sporulation protein YqfC|nr:sporulation protein YqfC [Clostridiales bacterium]